MIVNLRAGTRMYAENDCSACHKIRGEGNNSGPDLSFIGKAPAVEWMKQYIRSPDSLKINSATPLFKRLNPTELDQLVA